MSEAGKTARFRRLITRKEFEDFPEWQTGYEFVGRVCRDNGDVEEIEVAGQARVHSITSLEKIGDKS